MSRRRSVVGPRARTAARLLAGAALLGLLLLAAGGLLGTARDDLLTLFPLFALIVVLVVRPYAGERLIARMRAARARRARPPGVVTVLPRALGFGRVAVAVV